MLYELIELQRAAWRPVAGMLQRAASLPGIAPWTAPWAAPWAASLAATGDILARLAGEAVPARSSLALHLNGAGGAPLRVTTLFASPWVEILRLGRAPTQQPANLLLAPYSGYADSVLGSVATALLELGDVVVTSWVDARYVPLTAGRFGFAEQTEVAALALAAAGPAAGIVAVSQSGIAALRMLQQHDPAAGRRLVLLGCPIDPRPFQTPLQSWIEQLPEQAILEGMLLTVPTSLPGAGRPVLPGFFQVMGSIATTPAHYAALQAGFMLERCGLLPGHGFALQHAEAHAVIDVPGELFLELVQFLRERDERVIRAVLGQSGPGRMRRIELLTIEAGADVLVGRHQTHGAADLLRPHLTRHEAVTIARAAHQDLFSGRRFAAELAPLLTGFLR